MPDAERNVYVGDRSGNVMAMSIGGVFAGIGVVLWVVQLFHGEIMFDGSDGGTVAIGLEFASAD